MTNSVLKLMTTIACILGKYAFKSGGVLRLFSRKIKFT